MVNIFYSVFKFEYQSITAGNIMIKIDSTLTPDPTTHNCNSIEAPAEPSGASSDPFPIPPLGSGGASTSITALNSAIVKEFNNYSIEVKVDAAREMINRLNRRYFR